MIFVIASIQVKEGHLPEFVELFKSNIPNVLEEEGCIEYVATVDLPTGLPPQEINVNVVTVIEKWRRPEDLKAHLSAPHMQVFRTKAKDLVEKTSFKVLAEA